MDLEVVKFIGALNELYAGEWLAMYQYWLGARLCSNANSATIRELNKHAAEELEHANLLAKKIIELGGIPVISPARLTSISCCEYLPPVDRNVLAILAQNITGEEDAIVKYTKALPLVVDQDSYNMLKYIISMEEEHKTDLIKLKLKEDKDSL